VYTDQRLDLDCESSIRVMKIGVGRNNFPIGKKDKTSCVSRQIEGANAWFVLGGFGYDMKIISGNFKVPE